MEDWKRLAACAAIAGMLFAAPAFAGAADAPVLDKYGQITGTSYPSKVTQDSDLTGDVARDEEYFSSLQPPVRDAWGGELGSKEQYGLSATGYFHVETISDSKTGTGEKTVLVTPDGNLYVSLGTCVTDLFDSYTNPTGNEEHFSELPPKTGAYAAAWNWSQVSFYIANRIIKTGSFDEEAWYTEMVERLKKWGFTGVGAWSRQDSARANEFPNVPLLKFGGDGANLPRFGAGGYTDMPDPYDAAFDSRLDAYFAGFANSATDRTIVGYFFGNEVHYEKFMEAVTTSATKGKAVRAAFEAFLAERYASLSDFNAAWGTSYSAYSSIGAQPVTAAGKNDVYAFFAEYIDLLYQKIHTTFRKYDPNHLLMGERLLGSSVTTLNLRVPIMEAAGKYTDVVSYNYYTQFPDNELIHKMHEESGGLPILITEYHTTEPSHGFQGGMNGAVAVDSEQARGEHYKRYVESLVSTGFVVGAHYFCFLDQPATGRGTEGTGFGGESYACGIVDVTDRPYKEMLEYVMDANYDIYDTLMGEEVATGTMQNGWFIESDFAASDQKNYISVSTSGDLTIRRGESEAKRRALRATKTFEPVGGKTTISFDFSAHLDRYYNALELYSGRTLVGDFMYMKQADSGSENLVLSVNGSPYAKIGTRGREVSLQFDVDFDAKTISVTAGETAVAGLQDIPFYNMAQDVNSVDRFCVNTRQYTTGQVTLSNLQIEGDPPAVPGGCAVTFRTMSAELHEPTVTGASMVYATIELTDQFPAERATPILVAHDQDGHLAGMDYGLLNRGGSMTLIVNGLDPAQRYTVQVLLWDSLTSMAPLAEVIVPDK